MAKAKENPFANDDPSTDMEIGKVYCFQEAQGYIVGTVVAETPFKIKLGRDACWIQSAGDQMEAFERGEPVRWFPLESLTLYVHGIRYYWPSKYPSPRRG